MTAKRLPKVLAPDYAAGVDRKQLKQIRDRFLAINEERLRRTRDAMPIRQHAVLELLPLLWHINHPLMPGYVSQDTPAILANYEPDKAVIRSAQRFSQTFRYRKESRRGQANIRGIFLMGSVGSISHSESSDIDIWLCHSSSLSRGDLQKLKRKAEKIEAWAAGLGLEIHFFLMNASEFRRGHYDAAVDKESSGSAQHYLLLDEFYRTALYLGGCYPLWWLIPAAQEARYDELSELLIVKRFIKTEEYIDFGAIDRIPEAEFIGAGLWQLYKGIDAPYKSILKLLLMEVYASELPERPNLSLEFKAAVYEDRLDVDQLDPYFMLFNRLQNYLLAREESERLELIRRSFYLKVNRKLSAAPSTRGVSWQRRMLAEIVEQWGWDNRQLARLDNRQQWRIEEVQPERRLIVNELTHGYRALSRYSRATGIRARISKDDLTLLGRKLYAAFQRKAGKVDMINPGITPTMREESISFHFHGGQQVTVKRQGWSLFKNLSSITDAPFHAPLKQSGSLIELIAWSYFNGMLTRQTRLALAQGETAMSLYELQHIVGAFEQFSEAPLPPATQQAFVGTSHPIKTLLIVNVGLDPLEALSARGVHKVSDRNDSLGYSSLRDNLVQTIDQVTVTSWHEVLVYRYELGDTLIQCLKNYLASLVETKTPPQLEVRCYCPNRANAIARRVEELFHDVLACFFPQGCGAPSNARYVVEMDRRFFMLSFEGDQPRFAVFNTLEELLTALERPQDEYSPVVFDARALLDEPRLHAVVGRSKPGVIQVFYELAGDTAELFVVDENGALLSWSQRCESEDGLLLPMHRFLMVVVERRMIHFSLEGLGEGLECRFYRLLPGEKGREYRVKEVEIPLKERQRGYHEVQAIGHTGTDGEILFDVYCGPQEFLSLEYGDQLYAAVADYIRSIRKGGERYPCYITDLGLPHDLDNQQYQRELKTVQYLYFKRQLENRLNRALVGSS